MFLHQIKHGNDFLTVGLDISVIKETVKSCFLNHFERPCSSITVTTDRHERFTIDDKSAVFVNQSGIGGNFIICGPDGEFELLFLKKKFFVEVKQLNIHVCIADC